MDRKVRRRVARFIAGVIRLTFTAKWKKPHCLSIEHWKRLDVKVVRRGNKKWLCPTKHYLNQYVYRKISREMRGYV